jgi:NADH-quinone oxidoreductase subunit M
MNPLYLPWLELAIATSLFGSLCVSRIRDPDRAAFWGWVFTGAAFSATFLAWLAFYQRVPLDELERFSPQASLFGRRLFSLDEFNAPLVPAVALLHFLTALATARTMMRRFSFAWSLAEETIRLATFSSRDPWLLIALLAVSTVPPYLELRNRGRPTRVYLLHMGLFVSLLVLGWAAVGSGRSSPPPTWGILLLLAAILIRCGTVPAHCWLTDWFENASFGNALLFVVPLSGVYAAVRLLLPIAPNWALRLIGIVSLTTAVYAAGMASVQREARRLFAYVFLSIAALVMVGLEMHTELSLTGSLCVWFAVILSLGGFGLTLRALEARFGRLSLSEYHGLYEHSPTLAVFFLLTGLASVGFPGTVGFISTDLLVDGVVEASLYVGLAVVVAAAINGIAVMRAYFLLFTGARHGSTVALGITPRERFAVLTLAALILGGGVLPQPGIMSRQHAAELILRDRESRARGAEPGRPTEPPDVASNRVVEPPQSR